MLPRRLGVGLDGFQGPFWHKLFCDSMNLVSAPNGDWQAPLSLSGPHQNLNLGHLPLSPGTPFCLDQGPRPASGNSMPGHVPCCPGWASWASPGGTCFSSWPRPGRGELCPFQGSLSHAGSEHCSSFHLTSPQGEIPMWISAQQLLIWIARDSWAEMSLGKLILPATRVEPFGKLNLNFRDRTCSSHSLKWWIVTANDKTVLFVKRK